MISIHLPKTPETLGLIGKDQLALTKPGVLIVNAARGGLVDEDALAEAVRSGHVGGAGIDVYVTEPTTSSPLFELPQVVVTPHLGASTDEAQDRAGHRRRPLRAARPRGRVRAGRGERAGHAAWWARRCGPGCRSPRSSARCCTRWPGGCPAPSPSTCRGELAAEDVSVLPLAALRGVFTHVVDEQVTFVNVPALAAERGVGVELTTVAGERRTTAASCSCAPRCRTARRSPSPAR